MLWLVLLTVFSVASRLCVAVDAPAPDYAVVVSKGTAGAAGWGEVVEALREKHGASVITYNASVDESLAALKKTFPRYVCFVARPEEAKREFVARVHELTRKLDDDPYIDFLWGILTGYDADCALRTARHREPLVVRRVASGTDVALEMCEEGIWYCELKKNRVVRKKPGDRPLEEQGPDDTTRALVDTLNVYKADLFVTSGHATEKDWQIGYRYRNGSFRCKEGQMFGLDTAGKRHDINSPNPKVYLPIGNCLMGHIDSREAMALAWMNTVGVMQMIGYTKPTWFGYAGWGCLDYFLEQPGRYTFAEAFFANHHALIHRLVTEFPEQAGGQGRGRTAGARRGLLFDRDVVAFYGDPAWEARMAPGSVAWEQSLKEVDGVYTFQITPKRGKKTFEPINTNGSQRGWRPIVQFLPHRVKEIEILDGKDLQPVISDDFLLIPNPRTCDTKRDYRVTFRAKRID
jgi:zinc protease